jgi:hypothetical protein
LENKPHSSEQTVPTDTPAYYTSGELGDLLGVQAWKISRLFELSLLEEPPRIGGRRLIPRTLIPTIVARLLERGWIDTEQAVSCERGDRSQEVRVNHNALAPAPATSDVPPDPMTTEQIAKTDQAAAKMRRAQLAAEQRRFKVQTAAELESEQAKAARTGKEVAQ